jgi:mRNA-degrading endonuclease toxin of MazEF toxin-antitoxin module
MALEQGDLIYINFSPQSGHEQRDVRPAIVLQDSKSQRKSTQRNS